jgi:hypothetical protein
VTDIPHSLLHFSVFLHLKVLDSHVCNPGFLSSIRPLGSPLWAVLLCAWPQDSKTGTRT